jgi:Fe-S-cluster containining protein
MYFEGKCSGQCCQSIVIPGFTQEDLRAAYLAWLRSEPEFTGPSGTFPMIRDIFLLYPMLKPKGYDQDKREVFSCKNYDTQTGLCTIYEIRPTMCRVYPGGRCPCAGCTVTPA